MQTNSMVYIHAINYYLLIFNTDRMPYSKQFILLFKLIELTFARFERFAKSSYQLFIPFSQEISYTNNYDSSYFGTTQIKQSHCIFFQEKLWFMRLVVSSEH